MTLRALWISSCTGSPASVRPDVALARGLVDAGVSLKVIARSGSEFWAAMERAGIPPVGALPERWLERGTAAWLRDGCEADGIELVHLLDRPAAITALPALRQLRLGVVMRHDRPGGSKRWNPFARLSELHPRIDVVACTSEAARRDLARRRDPAGVLYLPPGHSVDWHAGPPAHLGQFGIPPGAFVVAVLANYRPRKGIEYVVEAAQWLPAQAPVHFLLIGAGLENRAVLERVARSPWRRNFHLLGHRDDAPAILAACSVSVRGAVRREGLSQGVMESMACGVPPIVTDAGGLPELVVQGESGIIVPRRNARAIGEALAWLLEHPEARRAMGRAARERIASEFPVERAVARHLELYRALQAGLAI